MNLSLLVLLLIVIALSVSKATEYSPCNNFYEYVCQEEPKLAVDTFEDVAKKNIKKVINVLNSNNEPDTSFWLRHTRQFWERCLWEKEQFILTHSHQSEGNAEDICFKELVRRKEYWNSINRIFLDATLPNDEDVRAEFLDDVSLVTSNILTALQKRVSSMEYMSEQYRDIIFGKFATVDVITAYIDEIEEDRFINEQFFRAMPFHTPLIIDSVALFDYKTNGGIFPLGMLQPPIYESGDVPKRFGRMGFLMAQFLGHEINNVAIRDGGTYEVYQNYTKQFDAAFNCFRGQYHGLNNSDEYAGENIADFVGLTAAYTAFKYEVRKQKDQRSLQKKFFEGFTQLFCSSLSQERRYIRESAPYLYRVLGVLQNMGEFAETYDCKEVDKYIRTNRCDIWNPHMDMSYN